MYQYNIEDKNKGVKGVIILKNLLSKNNLEVLGYGLPLDLKTLLENELECENNKILFISKKLKPLIDFNSIKI